MHGAHAHAAGIVTSPSPSPPFIMHRLHRAAAGWARRVATAARTHTAQGARWSGAAAGLALAAIGTATAARHTTLLANEAAGTKTSCCHAQTSAKQPAAASGATPLQLAQAELIALLGSERVSSEASDLTTHTSDAFSYHKSEATDDDAAGTLRGLVVYPLSTEEVSAVVKICVRHRVTMIPYGSGTSLEGQTISTASSNSASELASCAHINVACSFDRPHLCSSGRRVHRSLADAVPPRAARG